MYTEEFGLQSYLINSVRKSKAKVRQNTLSPLSLLDIVAYRKENRGLQRVSELKNLSSRQSPPGIEKITVTIFLAEILNKTLKAEEPDPTLFSFIEESIRELETEDFDSKFHLSFLLGLSRLMGFYPSLDYEEDFVFDLMEGRYCPASFITHAHFMEKDTSRALYELMSSEHPKSLAFPKILRNKLLLSLLDYYQLHIPGFGILKSLEVLQEVLND